MTLAIIMDCIVTIVHCLGTRSDGSDAIHETGHGYYDNNNQYRYEKIREDGVECPDVLAGHRRGGGGFPMRSMSSSRRYRSVGATAAVASVSGGEMDMSYEVFTSMHELILLYASTFSVYSCVIH